MVCLLRIFIKIGKRVTLSILLWRKNAMKFIRTRYFADQYRNFCAVIAFKAYTKDLKKIIENVIERGYYHARY